MTKAELVVKIAEKARVTKKDAEACVNAFTEAVVEAITAGDKVALVGFGTFSSVKKAARTGRNPQTGKELKIAAKTVGKFSAGVTMKNLVPAATPKAPAKKK